MSSEAVAVLHVTSRQAAGWEVVVPGLATGGVSRVLGGVTASSSCLHLKVLRSDCTSPCRCSPLSPGDWAVPASCSCTCCQCWPPGRPPPLPPRGCPPWRPARARCRPLGLTSPPGWRRRGVSSSLLCCRNKDISGWDCPGCAPPRHGGVRGSRATVCWPRRVSPRSRRGTGGGGRSPRSPSSHEGPPPLQAGEAPGSPRCREEVLSSAPG